MNELHYLTIGDFQYPALVPQEQTQEPLGKYGRMRKRYLQDHRPILWNSLRLSGQLYSHLQEVDKAASRTLEQILPALMCTAGATETLKTTDPFRWTGLMNTCKAQAEEIILTDLVFT